MTFKLERVHYMPQELSPGILYISEEFDIALHLCACGCGEKVSTPLGPTEWSVRDGHGGPSLWPSVGGWQQECRSHYMITRGRVEWEGQWTDEQVANGRRREEERRVAHYRQLRSAKPGFLRRIWRWLSDRFAR